MELYAGKLPWKGLKVIFLSFVLIIRFFKTSEEISKMKQVSQENGKLMSQLPNQAHELLKLINALNFYDTPDYKKMHGILNEIVGEVSYV